jgi:hypothetical protein
MSGAVTLLPRYAIMAQTGTNLHKVLLTQQPRGQLHGQNMLFM